MSEDARKLLADALKLPVPDRASMAAELLASLDQESEKDLQVAWVKKIEERARRAIADPEGGVDWETVRDEIRAELRGLRSA